MEQFDDYIDGALSPEEALALERQLAADPALAAEFAAHQAARDVVMRAGRAREFRLKIKAGLEKEGFFEQFEAAPKRSPKINKWKLSSLVLLFLLAGGVFWGIKNRLGEEQEQERLNREVARREAQMAVMQADYERLQRELDVALANPEQGNDAVIQPEITRLRQETARLAGELRRLRNESAPPCAPVDVGPYLLPADTTMAVAVRGDDRYKASFKAEVAYNQKRYAESIRILTEIPNDDPGYNGVAFLLPYALFRDKRYEEAAEAFLKLAEKSPSKLFDAQYYWMLCRLAQGRCTDARLMRQTILANKDHRYLKETRTIPRAVFGIAE